MPSTGGTGKIRTATHEMGMVFESSPRGTIDLSVIELTRESYVSPLNPAKIFGRTALLHVDLGCGDGSFLFALAWRMPEKNFLGIERLARRVRKAADKTAGLNNVRLLAVESSYAVRYLLPAGSVETFYLLFPDPWPKRRHQRRRIVTVDFLDSVHAALGGSGVLFIATDHFDYFREVERIAQNHPGFAAAAITDDSATPKSWRTQLDLPITKFEQKFCERGVPIYWLELRKVAPVT